MSDNTKICSICGTPFTEWGNNAQPVNTGRCCNLCNDTVVIPARIRAMRKRQQEDSVVDPPVARTTTDEAPVSVDATEPEPEPAQTSFSWNNKHDKKEG